MYNHLPSYLRPFAMAYTKQLPYLTLSIFIMFINEYIIKKMCFLYKASSFIFTYLTLHYFLHYLPFFNLFLVVLHFYIPNSHIYQ